MVWDWFGKFAFSLRAAAGAAQRNFWWRGRKVPARTHYACGTAVESGNPQREKALRPRGAQGRSFPAVGKQASRHQSKGATRVSSAVRHLGAGSLMQHEFADDQHSETREVRRHGISACAMTRGLICRYCHAESRRIRALRVPSDTQPVPRWTRQCIVSALRRTFSEGRRRARKIDAATGGRGRPGQGWRGARASSHDAISVSALGRSTSWRMRW